MHSNFIQKIPQTIENTFMGFEIICGGGGIRTHEPLAGHGVPGRWNKPLSDPSLFW